MAEILSEKGARLVVKVGGSLAETDRLALVLEMIATARRPVVIVPGGGAFADKVRDLQSVLRFDDKSAHRLAILGMHQMAEIYFKMEPRLAPAESLDGIDRLLSAGRVPVWLPLNMCEEDDTIPADWSITSDGLAARLAERLGGATVVLVKSTEVDATLSAEALSDAGIVDHVFPRILSRARLDWRVLGLDDDAALAGLLVNGTQSAGRS